MRICIVLTNSSQISIDYYNKQEIGLAKSLLEHGVSTDIFSYSTNVKTIKCFDLRKDNQAEIRTFEYPGIRLPGQQAFSISLLKHLLHNYQQYSLFQVHGSKQIISVFVTTLASFVKKPCVLCEGRYKDFPELHKKILLRIYF